MQPIGHGGVDFDAAVHRAWVQDQQLTRRSRYSLRGDAEHAIVFAQRRDIPGCHTLQLQTQHVQRLCPFYRAFDAIEHFYAELLDAIREQ